MDQEIERIKQQKIKKLMEAKKMKIEVFTSPTCPYCPPAKQVVAKVANELGLQVINWNTATPEGAQRAMQFNIQGVPTTIINEKDGFVGVPNETKLKEFLKSRMQ